MSTFLFLLKELLILADVLFSRALLSEWHESNILSSFLPLDEYEIKKERLFLVNLINAWGHWVYVPAFFLCCTVCQQTLTQILSTKPLQRENFSSFISFMLPPWSLLVSHCSSLTSLFYPSFMGFFLRSLQLLHYPCLFFIVFFLFFCSIYLWCVGSIQQCSLLKDAPRYFLLSFLQDIKKPWSDPSKHKSISFFKPANMLTCPVQNIHAANNNCKQLYILKCKDFIKICKCIYYVY